MQNILTDLERLRLDKLTWLYCMEEGDEDGASSYGGDGPGAAALYAFLFHHEIMLDPADVEAIVARKTGISDELAAAIEEGFNMPSGWLSQA